MKDELIIDGMPSRHDVVGKMIVGLTIHYPKEQTILELADIPKKEERKYCCGSFERSFKDGVISPPLPGRHHHHIEAVQAKLVISNCPFCGSKLK